MQHCSTASKQQETPQRSASQWDIMMMFSAVRAEAGGMMAAVQRVGSKWLFTREQLENTPSRRCGVEPDRELSYRQQAANLVQDMGQRLNVYPSQKQQR